MASTYSSLKIELIGTGEQAGTWGVTTNTNLGTALEQAIVGKADVTMSSTTVTLTLTNTNAAQDARAIYLNLTGSPGGAAVLEVPAIEKPYIVKNGSDQQVTIKVSGQTGVPIPTGKTMWVYNNGTDVVNAIDNLPSGTTLNGGTILSGNVDLTSEVTGTLPVANGGTGITSFGTGVATALGQNVSGSGSIALTTSPSFTTPVLGTPTSGTLTNCTGLPIATGVSGLGSNVATFLATPSSANLASAVTDETGSGALVFGTTPTLTGLREKSVAVAASDINLASGNYFTKTISGTTTFTVSNVASSGDVASFIIILTNGGSATVNWFSGVTWAAGTAPTLTTSGVDLIGFFTIDGGTTWRGLVLALDIKAP